jgi:hypothetical protein
MGEKNSTCLLQHLLGWIAQWLDSPKPFELDSPIAPTFGKHFLDCIAPTLKFAEKKNICAHMQHPGP